MRLIARRYLFVCLLMLTLAVKPSHAQQQPATGTFLPGDPLAPKDPPASAGRGVQGDPFGAGPDDDPFASEPAFRTNTNDGGSAPKDSEDAAAKQPTVDLHGHLESRNRVRTRNGEAISTRQRLWLEADGTLFPDRSRQGTPPVRFFASAALDVDPAAADLSDDHSLTRLHAQEVYVTFDTDRADLILGRKMLRWGTGDGINPLDLINPLDHRNPVASGRADARIPVILGQTVVRLPTFGVLQEAALEGVVVPLARVNRLNAPGAAWESNALKALRDADARGLLVLGGQERPDRPFADAEFGLRLATTFSGWDLALIGFRGYSDAPVFAREPAVAAADPGVLRLSPVHPTFSAAGLNFAKGLDRSTLRGELALKPDLPVMLADRSAVPGYVRRSVVEGVLGVDRTLGTNFYTNLQYFFTYIDNPDGLVLDAFDHGISYDIHDLFLQDALEAGARGIISFSGQGWTGELYGEYKIGDDWLLAAGLLFFEGSQTGRYGQFTDNDMLTLRLRRSF